ncbi:MAG: hypothetical protein R2850_04875 [Bacteroidia bacterium]
MLGFLTSCLRDDFSKLAESEWSPDFAFPIVYSELDVNDLLLQEKSPTEIDPDALGLVRIIYHSDNHSDIAGNLINLPQPEANFQLQLPAGSVNNFNSSGNGSVLEDSLIQLASYSIGPASRIDTVFFREGIVRMAVQSMVAQPAQVRFVIPNLLIQQQGLLQPFELEAAPGSTSQSEATRNLNGAMLLPDPSGQITLKMFVKITKSGSGQINTGETHFTGNISFENSKFKGISGYFANLQMPAITNDTLQIKLFKNAISADILQFERASTEFIVQNSTGIPFSFNLQQVDAFRTGENIPGLNLSAFSFPDVVNGSRQSIGTGNYLYDETNSNITELVNRFPVFMLSEESFSPQQNSGLSYLLRDTSRFRVYQKLILPLNGLTLDLKLRDTFEFDFHTINKDVEEVLLRLNLSNGFPVQGLLQVYFGRQAENQPHAPVFLVDSLFGTGNLPVLIAPQVNAAGEAIGQTNRITDAVMTGEEWQVLKDLNCNRIIINARLTTSGDALSEVRILEDDLMSIRIGARIKLRTKF